MPCNGCPCPRCTWIRYPKHLGHKGLKPAHTIDKNPAKYLPSTDVRALETATVTRPDRAVGDATAVSEYLRDTGTTIGYDEGVAARWSFVQCGTGTGARSYHGQPMQEGNARTRGDAWIECGEARE